MESAGQTIDDDALRLAMKDRGLGTPATRAAIIETLVKRDYVVRIKQQLVPTALGVVLIETLPVASLASPELTGAWEARLARIARGEDSRAAFMADIARYVAETVDAIRGSAPPAAPVNAAASTGPEAGPEAATYHRSMRPSSGGHPSRRGARSPRTPRAPKLPRRTRASKPARGTRDVLDVELPCPRCQVGFLITGSRGWGCSRWRDGCRFVIWFETAGRRLSVAQLRDLVTRGKTRKARFRTQSGAEIDGRLVLDLDSDGGSARLVPG
jgi:DNA topoisomerase-3